MMPWLDTTKIRYFIISKTLSPRCFEVMLMRTAQTFMHSMVPCCTVAIFAFPSVVVRG